MIYIIDSSVHTGLRSLDKAIDFLDRHNVKYKIIQDPIYNKYKTSAV